MPKSKIKDSEWEKLKKKKLDATDIKNLKIERITDDEINSMNDSDNKAAYLYYLMNKRLCLWWKDNSYRWCYRWKYAYISENNEELTGFNTRLDWERVYPYGDTFKTILGKVSSASQGLPVEEKEYYLKQGYSLNDRVGISYIEKQYETYLRGTKAVYEVINSNELKLVSEGKRGNDIVLTIDINFQQQLEEILTDEVTKRQRVKLIHSTMIILQQSYRILKQVKC